MNEEAKQNVIASLRDLREKLWIDVFDKTTNREIEDRAGRICQDVEGLERDIVEKTKGEDWHTQDGD